MEENLRLDSREAHSGRWLDSSPTRPPAVREYNLSAQLLARRSFWVGWLGLRLYVQLIRLRCSHKQAAMAGLTEDGVPPQSRRGFAWGGRVIKKINTWCLSQGCNRISSRAFHFVLSGSHAQSPMLRDANRHVLTATQAAMLGGIMFT